MFQNTVDDEREQSRCRELEKSESSQSKSAARTQLLNEEYFRTAFDCYDRNKREKSLAKEQRTRVPWRERARIGERR